MPKIKEFRFEEKSKKQDTRIPYSEEELFGVGDQRTYTGEHLKEIAFPLGGIGTGTVSLGGRGELRDWEIFNRPGKGKILPYTFTAIYAKASGKEPAARVLESRLQPPYVNGHGLSPALVSGLPRLDGAIFHGEYPFAHIDFQDKTLPVKVSLDAFNPFIPLNDKDSGLPVAIFRYTVKNPSAKPVDVTICFSLFNAVGYDGSMGLGWRGSPLLGENLNEYVEGRDFRGLRMTSAKYTADRKQFGSMALVTPHRDTTILRAWLRAGKWDDIQSFWDDFRTDGILEDNGPEDPSPDNYSDVGSLGLKVRLKPGESAELPFILAWHFPNRENHWDRDEACCGKIIRNWYATQFEDAWDAAAYTIKNLNRLQAETRKFHKTLFESALPAIVLDAASANMSIMRTNTCLRAEDGRFYAFEGCNEDSGCCPLNCTHVWNYEQAVAHLFPALERTMRLTDYEANVLDSGKMAFRTKLPLGSALWEFGGAADGQMGCILKLYREWKLSGDNEFLKSLYPSAKKTMEYVWVEWDKDKDGMMEGFQHNTYDIEFLGPNTMVGTFYLGALRAMEEMAKALGDDAGAMEYREIYDKGRANHDSLLWNGEFYIQKYDPNEAPRYQYGEGCLSDQMLGQWFAHVVGLGYLLPEEHVKKAIHSVFKHNWKADLMGHETVQRVYALNDEAGLILCTWPNGGRPAFPMIYSDEVWTGFEYQVAAHLIYEGFIEEGLAIVKGARDRHDGKRRNPWNEFECGHHYARAMSSWSLLLALSGYENSAPDKFISFAPKVNADDFRCFFSTGSCWGSFAQKWKDKGLEAEVEVRYGTLELKSLKLWVKKIGEPRVRVSLGGKAIEATAEAVGSDLIVHLTKAVKVAVGETLRLKLA